MYTRDLAERGKKYNLPGYNIHRNDRNDSKSSGGGCAIFTKKGLPLNYIIDNDKCVQFQIAEVYNIDKNKININDYAYNPCLNIKDNYLTQI